MVRSYTEAIPRVYKGIIRIEGYKEREVWGYTVMG